MKTNSGLQLYSRPVETVFDLLGESENGFTKAIGFVLSTCEDFRNKFLQHFAIRSSKPITITLQEYQKGSGITDIEILNQDFHLILEAKLALDLPTENQLRRYRDRLLPSTGHIVACSGSPREFATLRLRQMLGHGCSIEKVPVSFISYDEIATLASVSRPSNLYERRKLNDLKKYLMKQSNLISQSNMVFVKALSVGTEEWQSISYIDVVDKHDVYFHDVGRSGYPKTPPNYFGFSWSGKLQYVRHVESWKITHDLGAELSFIDQKRWRQRAGNPHVLYRLGPKIIPSHEIMANIRNTPYNLPIDILLTSTNVKVAKSDWDARKQREGIE